MKKIIIILLCLVGIAFADGKVRIGIAKPSILCSRSGDCITHGLKFQVINNTSLPVTNIKIKATLRIGNDVAYSGIHDVSVDVQPGEILWTYVKYKTGDINMSDFPSQKKPVIIIELIE